MEVVYQFDWADSARFAAERDAAPAGGSTLPRERVERTLLLHWQEHCIECAPPQCYEVCPLYVARADRKCARFVYGIYPNERFSGLFDYGADVRFRRWAKLEAALPGGSVSVERHRHLASADGMVTRAVNAVSGPLETLNPKRRLNGALTALRETVLHRLQPGPAAYDELVLECFSPDEEPFRLVLEQVRGDTVVLRHSFDIEPGPNFHTLPAERFGDLSEGRILLYPENDAERRLVFTWLDFVRYAPVAARNGSAPSAGPAAKVKVVAWDLDNTLWTGTLLEDGPEACTLRDEAAELVRALDERGILQTVVSKNDHDDAWRMIERCGLAEYFLSPAIGWGQKSESLRSVAAKLNLGLDSFAFIDDSPFERAEVEAALPMVRVYSEAGLAELLGRPEFDVPVTETSRQRRLLYAVEAERGHAEASFAGDYDEFLRSCEMRMRIFAPRSEAEVTRCLELVQRSNQLNLSTRRYTAEDFQELLDTPGLLTVAVECSDRFGEYGIVGFASVDERGEPPLVLDYVLSCRVAQKRVEQTFFEWLGQREAELGAERLQADLIETPRNVALRRIFEELPFRAVERDPPRIRYELSLDPPPPLGDVIALDAEALLQPA
jgi:FkbH-like protein